MSNKTVELYFSRHWTNWVSIAYNLLDSFTVIFKIKLLKLKDKLNYKIVLKRFMRLTCGSKRKWFRNFRDGIECLVGCCGACRLERVTLGFIGRIEKYIKMQFVGRVLDY